MPSASRTAAVHLRPAGSPVRLSLGEGDRLRQRPPARGASWANAGYHIWDMHDGQGLMGAAACLVVPWFADRYEKGADWRQLAWWIHDHLPYGHLEFYPKLCAFNIQWSEHHASASTASFAARLPDHARHAQSWSRPFGLVPGFPPLHDHK